MDTAESIERFRAERRYLLEEGGKRRADALAMRDGTYDTAYRSAELHDRAHEMHERYVELLPTVPVSRCPRTGELWSWRVDVVDLDGWFWQYEGATRRLKENLPLTWLAVTGAMRVAEPVPWTRFVVSPGPGAPYVIPRILEHPEIVAVISQLPVGPHTGWPVTYFGSRSTGETMVNDWGRDMFDSYAPDGTWEGWSADEVFFDDMDFELEPWVRSGDLHWIAPGDTTMTPRTGIEGCPYLDLDGPRAEARIERGHLEYPRLRLGPR